MIISMRSVCCCLAIFVWLPIGWSLRPHFWLLESKPDEMIPKQTTPQERQKFLTDLLLQVHKPLLNEQLSELGRVLNKEPEKYHEASWSMLQGFIERVRQGRIMSPFSIYNQLSEDLPFQLLGVYRFLVFAKTWTDFKQNACYARKNFNPILFVNAIRLAVMVREDTKNLTLAAMDEVLPHLFYESGVIMAAEQVTWQQLAPLPSRTPQPRWHQVIDRFVSQQSGVRMSQNSRMELMLDDSVVIPLYKTVRLTSDVSVNEFWNDFVNWNLILSIDGTHTFVDYEVPQWNNTNRRTRRNSIIDGDRMVAFRNQSDEYLFRKKLEQNSRIKRVAEKSAKTRNGLYLLRNIQHMVAHLQLEKLATGVEETSFLEQLTVGGVPYKTPNMNSKDITSLVREAIASLRDDILTELQQQDLKPSSLQALYIAVEILGIRFFPLCRYLNRIVNGIVFETTTLGFGPTQLRDPIFRTFLYQLVELFTEFEPILISTRLVTIRNVSVDRLQTYEEVVGSDLVNLIDAQLLQSQRNNLDFLRRRLEVRQHRLNHRHFNISYEVHADVPSETLVRSYLVNPESSPLLLDCFVHNLEKGLNKFERRSIDIEWTRRDTPTLSDLYGSKDIPRRTNAGGWPHRLLLPRGTSKGLEMQLRVSVISLTNQMMGNTLRCDNEWIDGLQHVVSASFSKDIIIEHTGLIN